MAKQSFGFFRPLKTPILSLPANRVRRNYRGGALLDRWEGIAPAVDGNRPEDWIASTVQATNVGMPPVEGEGLSTVFDDSGKALRLADLLAAFPQYYLGQSHFASIGPRLGFLAKLLDSAMRLHLQAHPTAAFAQKHLNSRWGKLETYVILAVRNPQDAYVRLGFQRAPSPAEWRRIVLAQDLAAMEACFDPVPVKPGEVWLVPGGVPHAIGPGVLMLEIMEPTDLVVRCEFEREGIVVPPAGRFMGRDPDFALQIFDHTSRSVEQVRASFRLPPRRLGAHEERLIGPEHTDCFSVSRFACDGEAALAAAGRIRVGVATRGEGVLAAEGPKVALRPGARFLIAAECGECSISPRGGSLELLICSPNPAGSVRS